MTLVQAKDLDSVLTTISTTEIEIIKKRKTKAQPACEYLNLACSFDTETTSFKHMGKKCGLVYAWAMCVGNTLIRGRELEEFVNVLNTISEFFELVKNNRKLVIYVHNLAFDFQFIRNYFEWGRTFLMDARKPVIACTTNGFEFRCSYILSGLRCEKVAENLTSVKIEKLVGQLDYSKMRHTKTPLTDKELEYIDHDVKIVKYYIDECIKKDGDITKIPMTNTGYVRRFFRSLCLPPPKRGFHNDDYANYRLLMKHLTLTSGEYVLLKEGFQGGFTHANAHHSGKTFANVTSYDFTSSYPTVMVAERFPMSRGELYQIKDLEDFNKQIRLYCCLFEVTFYNIESLDRGDNAISLSKCRNVVNPVVDNGRIVSADELTITITDIDYGIYKQFYRFTDIMPGRFIRYKRGYLPTPFVKGIIKLYKDKTELKGVKGKEEEYQVKKGMLNSSYGMAVTDIVKDLWQYDNEHGYYSNNNLIEWDDDSHSYVNVNYGLDNIEKICNNIDENIDRYNSSKTRFLFYPWGVWITAYARRNLFRGILECGQDYIYADTDSIKILNADKHIDFIEGYNREIIEKLEKACEFHGIDKSDISPKGKPLGVWDLDGVYGRFKTLGAKRYMSENEGDIHITIAGVGKKKGAKFIVKKSEEKNKDVFELFDDGFVFDGEGTGKQTHTYCDDEVSGVMTDYLGNKAEFCSRSSIYLEPCNYVLSIGEDYRRYLEIMGVL